MFYVNDFRIPKNNKIFSETKATEKFSVIISKNKAKKKISQYSLAIAAKPLIHFASLFGSKLVSYKKNDVVGISLLSKLYSLSFIIAHLIASTTIKPYVWRQSISDVPLTILTKICSIVGCVEGVYSVFAIGILNAKQHVELFHKLDNIDTHFNISKTIFIRRRLLSILSAVIPLAQLIFILSLGNFHFQNIIIYLNIMLILLLGSILNYVLVNIYLKLLMLNALLINTVKDTMSNPKKIIFQDTIWDFVIKGIYIEPKIVQAEVMHCCWFELMQIYDKLADCILLFNEIYCGQVFAMYNTWLLLTLLTICKSLSPATKHSQAFFGSFILYLFTIVRPLFLVSVCEMFIRERKKTLGLLLHVLQLVEEDDQQFQQVKTMIMLVSSRKLEISTNVFTINVPTLMNFAGRIISYTVLVIQYFYSHVS